MDKRLLVHIQGARKVTGTLRGFDIFLNLVLDQARDETVPGREERIEGGMVVSDGSCSKEMSVAERTCILRSYEEILYQALRSSLRKVQALWSTNDKAKKHSRDKERQQVSGIPLLQSS